MTLFGKRAADDLWIAFGVRSGFHYIAVHELRVVATMHSTKRLNLPVCHAFIHNMKFNARECTLFQQPTVSLVLVYKMFLAATSNTFPPGSKPKPIASL